MKKLYITILFSLAFGFFVPQASAQLTQQQSSSSLQNQTGSAVQGATNTLQNGSSVQQDPSSLNKLSQGGSNIPLSSPSTTVPTPTPASNDTSSLAQTVIIVCFVVGVGIVALIIWGALDSRKEAKSATEEVILAQPKKKKPKSASRRKRKKPAHR